MLILILGLLLWSGLHLLRAVAPELRQAMTDRMGAASKGVIALGLVVSVVLMVVGYRMAVPVNLWTPPSFLGHINNLLMLLAFYMYLTTATKPGTAWVFGNLKNPQLTGFKVWTLAHLLVNGDVRDVVLFGGLLAWAVAEVIAAKHVEGLVDRSNAPISSPIVHAGVVLAVFAVVGGLHIWLGPNPFGGLY